MEQVGCLLNNPLVSVCLTCFNQELWIRDAVESVLIQETSFDFEIIISDDCSTDGTWSSLLNIQAEFPEKILLVRQEHNVGLAQNWADVIGKARAGYIAYLEGDDFWTDPLKLEKQFRQLNANSSYALSFHDYIVIDENGNKSPHQPFVNSAKRDRTKVEMASGCLIHQNTMMFRKNFDSLPNGFFQAPDHDTFFIGWLSNWGSAAYHNEIGPLMYRIHKKGLWGGRARIRRRRDNIETLKLIRKEVAPMLRISIDYRLISKSLRLSWLNLHSGLVLDSITCFSSTIYYFLRNPSLFLFCISRAYKDLKIDDDR